MWRSILENYKNCPQKTCLDSYSPLPSKRPPQKIIENPLIDILSSDGCSELYKIVFSHKYVLLKKILLHELYDLEHFKSQIALHCRLAKYETIITALEYGVYREPDLKQYAYIVYEYCGDPLSSRIADKYHEKVTYTVEDCRCFVDSLAKCLEPLQRQQLVHLGLSPSSVVYANGVSYISSLEFTVTITNFLAGTGICEYMPLPFGPAAYLSPEAISYINSKEHKGAEFNPYSASIYSIGLIVIRMLTQINEIGILSKPIKDIPNMLAKAWEDEPEGPSKLFLDVVRKVLLDPANENRIDYISLKAIFELINANKRDLLQDAIPLEKTKTQKRMEFYAKKVGKMLNLQDWVKPVVKYIPDYKGFDTFQLERLHFPVLNITAKQLIIIDLDKDTRKTRKVDFKENIGVGARVCMNNGSRIYLLGGHSKPGTEFYGKLWELALDTFSYTERSPMLTKRSHFGIVNTSTLLFVAGGISDWYTLQSAEFYEKSTDQWKPMGMLNEIKWCVSLCVCSTKSLYCFGGYVTEKGVYTNMSDPKTISLLIERYDLVKFPDMWEKIDLGKKTSYSPMAGMCAASVSPTQILIFGGRDKTEQEKDSAFLFDIINATVTCVMTMKYADSFEQQGYVNNGQVYALSIKSQGEKSSEVFIHSAKCIDSSWIWTFKSIKFES